MLLNNYETLASYDGIKFDVEVTIVEVTIVEVTIVKDLSYI